ncbi:SAVED domain-containing protein [Xenorhabdus khoisanae]|uniref:SAVED domain-containing protein n=1 Tax=Xenorhabdus khoisanae TaxID=880157 RepID=UPI00235A40C2|nr:SAVED domain-containing protein [Xenorhabdus khoisanae]MDC9613060.1 SAVED domain-containing protein [Xenorhabdus khoisanae]
MGNNANQFFNQASSHPIDSLNNFHQYHASLKKLVNWDGVGILTDNNNENTVILLSLNEEVIATLRLCLEPRDTVCCLKNLSENKNVVIYRNIQGYQITSYDLLTLDSIGKIWITAEKQSANMPINELENLFDRFENDRKLKGRGEGFSKDIKNTVWRESYSRCMFTGCGEKLNYDTVSGTEGNYAYLAHNVASSEQGARGITELSHKLSNDPDNILLLCDKHHRLIDKIAASDYTASMLSAMKKEFCIVANSLLDGLKYQPIPVYAVLWPVNSQTVSPPSYLQVASSLSRIKRRMHEQINILSDNEDLLITSPEILWQMMPNVIQSAADKVIQQTKGFGFNAALFGFGPTSALIGLGAKLGNKNDVTPMLRFREGGNWSWPSNVAVGDFYEIEGLNDLKENSETILNITLTAEPESLIGASEALSNEKNIQIITIKAKTEYMGNGAIPHPEDGKALTAELQSIFHKLKSEYGIQTIHLFTCASNAAAVFIGQAYDANHPEIIIYDFNSSTMIPRLQLKNENYKCLVSVFQQ